jgi:hypothetical protein
LNIYGYKKKKKKKKEAIETRASFFEAQILNRKYTKLECTGGTATVSSGCKRTEALLEKKRSGGTFTWRQWMIPIL